MKQGFGFGGCICQKWYIIGVVGFGNCLCGVSSASFFCQLETVIFHFIVFCHIRDTRGGGRVYPSAEMQLVYSTAPTDWATRELNNLWNLEVTVLLILFRAVGTVHKNMKKNQQKKQKKKTTSDELQFKRRIETIRTTALRKSARILRKVLVTWGELLSLRLEWKIVS